MNGSDGFLVPSAAERARWLSELGDREAHHRIAEGLACLSSADVEQPPDPKPAEGWLRVAAWNLERGRGPTTAAALLLGAHIDLALLSEVDVGMARTHNRDVARDVALALGAGCAFGVEFVELGLGKEADTRGLAEGENERALHGNAIVGPYELRAPEVVRLDDDGEWFDAQRGEPRVGGRMALVATIQLDGVDVQVTSVHLESRSDPEGRAAQMGRLLEAVDERGRGPAVVGGDLNTFGASIHELADRTALRRLREAEPARFSWPVAHEPLFEVAAEHGYRWVDANLAAPTTRHGPDGLPDHHPLKLDWLLVRGLEARRPTVVPAVAPDGTPLSDHDLVAASIRLERA